MVLQITQTNMKIAILGCGYVGQAIAQQWHQAGHELTVTTTSPQKISTLERIAQHVHLLEGNNLEHLREICEGQQVILLSVGSKGRTADSYRFAYLETAQTLKEVLQSNSTVQQIIYTSSYSIVGDHGGIWVDETTPDKPETVFANILKETEQVLLSLESPNRQACILRLGGIYGENREILKIFRSWFGTTRPGDGQEHGNWVHLDDIVSGIEFARQHHLSGVFNLVNDVPVQRKAMLEELAQKYHLPSVDWDSSQPSTRAFDVKVSNQKLKSLGFTFKHPAPDL